jgi:hypothetical protein
MVCVAGTWFPYTSIKELVERGPLYVAPRSWSAHVEVLLISGTILRVEGVSAAELSEDINAQIAESHRRQDGRRLG